MKETLSLLLISIILSMIISYGLSNVNSINQVDTEVLIDNLTKRAMASYPNDLHKTIECYTEVLELDSTNLTALFNRGAAFGEIGHTEECFQDFDKAIEYYPEDRTYCRRGMAYAATYNYSRAFEDFSTAIAINPNYADAYYGYSLVDIYFQKYDDALKWCNKGDSLSYDTLLSKYIRKEIAKSLAH